MSLESIVEQLLVFLGLSKKEKLSVIKGIQSFSAIPHDVGGVGAVAPEDNLLFCLAIASVEDYLQPYLDTFDDTGADKYRATSAILVILSLMVELTERDLRSGGDLGELWTQYGLGLPEWDALTLMSAFALDIRGERDSEQRLKVSESWDSFFGIFVPEPGSLRYR